MHAPFSHGSDVFVTQVLFKIERRKPAVCLYRSMHALFSQGSDVFITQFLFTQVPK